MDLGGQPNLRFIATLRTHRPYEIGFTVQSNLRFITISRSDIPERYKLDK